MVKLLDTLSVETPSYKNVIAGLSFVMEKPSLTTLVALVTVKENVPVTEFVCPANTTSEFVKAVLPPKVALPLNILLDLAVPVAVFVCVQVVPTLVVLLILTVVSTRDTKPVVENVSIKDVVCAPVPVEVETKLAIDVAPLTVRVE